LSVTSRVVVTRSGFLVYSTFHGLDICLDKLADK
jgi:hypothetical protein